jgi:hypothetical protein
MQKPDHVPRGPIHRSRTYRMISGAILATALVVSALTIGAAPAAAAPASPPSPTAPQMATTPGKVVAPAPQPGPNVVTAPVPGKDRRSGVRSALAFTVTLSVSNSDRWPTQYATLTATTNQDLGQTLYYLSIIDDHDGVVVVCSTGTTCAASVTQSSASLHFYTAYVSAYPTSTFPQDVQARTYTTSYVRWRALYSLKLDASRTTLPVGVETKLVATASEDVGPTPFFVEIFDTASGGLVAECGAGTTCVGTVTQTTETTHRFIAYFAASSAISPPSNIQYTANPSFVTWTGATITISLAVNSSGTVLTATTNQNVGPTPYFISIFDLATGNRLAICSTGQVCTAVFTPKGGDNSLVAFVSPYNATLVLPQTGSVASSNVAHYRVDPIT